MFLNFGHTIGHALEAASFFGISHGEAVSIGMVAEMRLTRSSEADRVCALLQKIEMPTEIPQKYGMETLLPLMRHDKKNTSADIRIAVPRALGKGELLHLDPAALQSR